VNTEEIKTLADFWGMKRIERLAAQKIVDKIEDEEKQLKAQLIQACKEAGISSIGGSKYGANYKTKDKPTVGDWAKLYAFIKENDAFDLLHKRLTEKAVEERWEDNVEIPGVVKFPVDDITMFTV
jgi:hypothetical protein